MKKGNPIIVFDDSSNSEVAPIEIGYRQPSFVSLKGELIPKGYDSFDDFIHEKGPVKVGPLINGNESINDIIENRNMEKWKSLGYDPTQIESQLNRQNSACIIRNPETNLSMQYGKFSSSFSQIDSIPISKQPLPMIMPIYEDSSETIPVQKSSSLSRSLSSGLALPNLEYPASMQEITEEDECSDSSDCSSYSDEYVLTLLENGMPKFVSEILRDQPSTIVYKALCGKQFPNLPYDIVSIITKQMIYYMNECLNSGYEAEAYHIQELIDSMRKSADRSQTPEDPGVLSKEVYDKKLNDAFLEFEKKIEYLDTQEFLNEDNKERSIKKLRGMKLSEKEKEDQLNVIRFTYDKTAFSINKSREQGLSELKSQITRLKQGITHNTNTTQLPYLTTRKVIGKQTNGLLRKGILRTSAARTLARPKSQLTNKCI